MKDSSLVLPSIGALNLPVIHKYCNQNHNSLDTKILWQRTSLPRVKKTKYLLKEILYSKPRLKPSQTL